MGPDGVFLHASDIREMDYVSKFFIARSQDIIQYSCLTIFNEVLHLPRSQENNVNNGILKSKSVTFIIGIALSLSRLAGNFR
jgi:hypothetical protein